jgi:type VI secretion system protein ImpL
MGVFKKILKNRQFIVALGIVLLIVLIWLVGMIELGSAPPLLSVKTRLLLSIIVVVVWIGLLLIEQLRAQRGASQLEQSLKTQADEQLLGVRPEKRQQIENLKQEFVAAIEALKKSKLAKGRRGNAALYALPWHLIIGPYASGKTTAIKNSGLEFPLGDKEIKGVGGTRNCDWWFTNSTILLDTAGRYATEEDDRTEWLAFLDMLKKHRKRQPINGVIVGVSITELLTANLDELEATAQNLRKRIDELIDRLQVKFPVYLLFTKCDLLNGFVEFFEDFSRSQREQIWGCTLKREQFTAPNFNPKTVFEEEFQQLYDTMINLRLSRLLASMKRENRRRVYVFPLEFYSAKANLAHFVGKLLQPNPYQESPLFRGFYFTSGTQEGAPIDRVIQSVADAFSLPPELTEQFSPEMETKSYFIKNLFTDVIVPDENLARLTSPAARRKRLVQYGGMAGVAALLALFLIGLFVSFGRGKSRLRDVGTVAERARDINWSDPGKWPNNFDNLDQLRTRIVDLEKRGAGPFNLWMDRSGSVLHPAYELYLHKMGPFVQQHLYRDLEARLLKQVGERSPDLDAIYDDLKAYLLFDQGKSYLNSEAGAQDFLASRLKLLWDAKKIYQPGTLQDKLVQDQLPLFVKGYALAVQSGQNGTTPVFKNDPPLIGAARGYIAPSMKSIDRFYKRLLRAANSQIAPRNLAGIAGRGIVRSDFQLAGVYSKEGWKKMEDLIEEGVDKLGPDWVLGEERVELAPELKDSKSAKQTLRDKYFKEYEQNWWRFLNSVDYEPPANLTQAAQNLKTLGDPGSSPLTLLFKKAKEETQFASLLQQKASQYIGGHSLDKQFEGLHRLLEGSDNQTKLNGMMSQYATLSGVMDNLSKDPENGKLAKENAANVLRGAGELPAALSAIEQTLSLIDPVAGSNLKPIFVKPLAYAWEAVLKQTQDYLNNAWRIRVHDAYARFAEFYPFRSVSGDAPVQEVKAFFQSGGVMAGFIDQEIKPFVRDETSWEPKTWQNRGIQFSATARGVFRQATLMSQGMSGNISFYLQQAQPPRKERITSNAPDVDKVRFVTGATKQEHHVEKQRGLALNFSWPGGSGVSLQAVNDKIGGGSTVAEKKFDGEWAWIRLVNDARLISRSGAQSVYEWTLYNPGRSYKIILRYTLSASLANHPLVRGFFGFGCPQQLN